jgi:DNA polymerase-3 subunit epsilon
MIREIALDTETTGLSPLTGDRVVEIGCVELINRVPSGRNFHAYINPERDMPQEAFEVHGLSAAFLADKPVFSAVVAEFFAFIGGDPLVIHNAAFDIGFLNHELKLAGQPLLGAERVVDSLLLARRRHPGGKNTLDALCTRYGIDRSRRVKHGALLDAEILAEVYAELAGGRQAALGLAVIAAPAQRRTESDGTARQRPVPLPARLSEAEREAHRAFIETMGDKAIWTAYLAGG